MFLAYNKIVPPKEWEHKPDLIESINKNTVAMLLAKNKINP